MFNWLSNTLIFCIIIFMSFTTAHESEKYHLYFWGNYDNLENQTIRAQKAFSKLLAQYQTSAIYPGYLLHLQKLQQYDAIVHLMPAVEKIIKPTDYKTQLLLIQALHETGKQHLIPAKITYLLQNHAQNPEVIFFTAMYYMQINNPGHAFIIVENYLQKAESHAKNFMFHFLKAQLLAHLNKHELAICEAKKCLVYNPEFEQAWIFIGLMYEIMGKKKEALHHYQDSLKVLGKHALIEQQIIHLNHYLK